MGGALVTTEDFDGDGLLDLMARFNGTFDSTLSFRDRHRQQERWRFT